MSTESFVVPVIDMENFPTELEKLSIVARELGCFRVVNHGMPATLQEEIKAISRFLLDMPIEAKLKNINDKIYNGGYAPPGKLGRLFESLGIYDAASQADVHSFCSAMQVSLHQRNSVHTDSCFLTLLQEDEFVGGLEIMNIDGNFVTIDPVPGTFLVNIGDAGKVWSNGRLTNVKHRVVCKKAMPRISIIMFLLSPKDDKIEPEATFIDYDHPRLYQTFNYKEYRKVKSLSGVKTDEILPLWKEEHA